MSFSVALIHLTMSLLTDYPGGAIKLIPLKAHLTVELIIGPLLGSFPWLLRYSWHTGATALHLTWGVISFLTFFVTIRTVPFRYEQESGSGA